MSPLLPSIDELGYASLDLLRSGVRSSRAMREALAPRYNLASDDEEWPRFVNRHAWALVRMQNDGLIKKTSPGTYELLDTKVSLSGKAVFTPPLKAGKPLPVWAKRLIQAANTRNHKKGAAETFSEADLRSLWKSCGGCCSMTGLPFLETRVGNGRAKRALAPSLDRIDPDEPYTRENCRLVRACVNFALNAFGDDIFLEMAKAAIAHQGKSKQSV